MKSGDLARVTPWRRKVGDIVIITSVEEKFVRILYPKTGVISPCSPHRLTVISESR